jgi:hypothetical protein
VNNADNWPDLAIGISMVFLGALFGLDAPRRSRTGRKPRDRRPRALATPRKMREHITLTGTDALA